MAFKEAMRRNLPESLYPFAKKVYDKVYDKAIKRTSPVNSSPLDESNGILDCIVAYNKYGGYCVPKSSLHRHAAQKVLSGKIYEPETIEFLINSLKEGDIVHAGTYFGDFLPALAKSRKDEAIIWAFEPNPDNFRCAQITIAINGLENVRLQNAALGDAECSLEMVTRDPRGKGLGGASQILSVDETKGIEKQVESINCVTIDTAVPKERNISIIQLDVEGFEKQALSGALNTIRRCLPIIILENLPEQVWFDDNIGKLGYRETNAVHGNKVFVPVRR